MTNVYATEERVRERERERLGAIDRTRSPPAALTPRGVLEGVYEAK